MPALSDLIFSSLPKIARPDTELLIAHSLKKPREWVLTHPEYTPTPTERRKITSLLKKRASGEPVAYIVGHKEFFGLNFEVNKHTLIPRPETELLVEKTLEYLKDNAIQELITKYESRSTKNTNPKHCIIDIGTGSGNIIISLAKQILHYSLPASPTGGPTTHYQLYGLDISKEALRIARRNDKCHDVEKEIKFLQSDLLHALLPKLTKQRNNQITIIANLPYLSPEIYSNAPRDVRDFEPKSALYSQAEGLAHYRKLFRQINKMLQVMDDTFPASRDRGQVTILLEFSPEQKSLLQKLIKISFSQAKVSFFKDISGRWRMAQIEP